MLEDTDAIPLVDSGWSEHADTHDSKSRPSGFCDDRPTADCERASFDRLSATR